MNGTRFVSPSTVTRVRAAIDELGYVPSGPARSLRTRSTTTIAVAISDISNPFFTTIVRGIEDGLNDQHYQLILCNTDEDPAKEDRYLRSLLGKRVDGLIIAPVGHASALLQKVWTHVPTLLIDRRSPNVNAPLITVDNERAARLAVDHLIGHGHRRIAAIVGLPQVSTSADRLAGYHRALRDAGLPVDPNLVRTGNSKIDGGFAAANELLRLEPSPTAIFASNNLMTLGVIKALTSARLRCPEDVALVGFDDHDWASEFTPPLTVVRQPTYDFGRAAAATILRLVRGQAAEDLPPMTAELVVRGSCGRHDG